ncbi:DNA-binding response regulator, OmpR family, contains REC and winged-helix (wHTH) domain [Streptosporangium subroseum]|uniref:DNA-binding response regulator, OmpR family, contains REC and winged-helix (WHTH) domain n=1 Tax=Streptosporangium subroseum TaxID=106412 RepID=A0A239HSN1_9ACTN|nr:response regulator transcription factor [Streptosporangium subroseum]SNS84326.1 DNA-binding response regulator, OmpR family, contains REC and winged-helix (wHTH) domain [Streptosporangium subroseum]
MRVLVVEDENEMADAIAHCLRRRAIAVDVVYDGAEAMDRLGYVDYDVVVLDRDLPELHGDEVCRRLVAMGGGGRILMLTAMGGVAERVDGLGLGADDYLPKPFAITELVARVRTLARRTVPARPIVLERAGVRLDPAGRTVTRDGRRVTLTRKEFALLGVLLRAGGEVVRTRDLLAEAWDEYYESGTGALRVAMATLRRKLGDPPVIETVPRRGYRL